MPDTHPGKPVQAELPADLPQEARKRLLELADSLEDLGRKAGAGGGFYCVDEECLRKILERHFPRNFEDRCIASLASLRDTKLVRTLPGTDPSNHDRRVGWSELSAQVTRRMPAPAGMDTGLSANSSEDDLLRAVKHLVPEVPEDFFAPDVLRAHLDRLFQDVPTGDLAKARAFYDPWGCMVNHLGFWGALAAVVIVAVVILALNAALAFTGALFWATFWGAMAAFGLAGAVFSVVIVLVTCLLGFTPPF